MIFLRKKSLLIWRKESLLVLKRSIARSEKEALFVLGNDNSIENPPAQCRDKSEILQGGIYNIGVF